MEIRLLGPLEVVTDAGNPALGGPKQRAVLAALAIAAGRTVTIDDLIDTVWGEDAHDRAANTLQVYVSNLRKALEPNRAAGAAPTLLVTRPGGYALAVGPEQVDALRAERLIAAGRDALRTGAAADADRLLTQALDCWYGTPLADIAAERLARHEAVRLDELRAGALEERIDARLELGRTTDLLPELEDLIRRYPYRERFRGQLMLALYRCGRQTDALAAYREAREMLLDEIGIDPSRELQDLERRILQQDPDLASGGLSASNTGVSAVAEADEAATVRVAAGEAIGLAFVELPDGTRIALAGQPCSIGRHRENQIPLADPDVSRRHAVIRLNGQAFVLTDLGSTNGTLVNGTSITEHTLAPGDLIAIGGTTLTFVPAAPLA